MKAQKQAKEVTVIAVYKFKQPINRICFETLSSDGATHYHTCFDQNAEKSSCTCPGGQSVRHNCYHQDGLRARAAEYFAARQPAQPVQAEKANPVAEAEAFIAKVQAEKATKEEKLARGAALMESGKVSVKGYSGLHNSNEGHFEKHGERLIPMR